MTSSNIRVQPSNLSKKSKKPKLLESATNSGSSSTQTDAETLFQHTLRAYHKLKEDKKNQAKTQAVIKLQANARRMQDRRDSNIANNIALARVQQSIHMQLRQDKVEDGKKEMSKQSNSETL